jgi:mRNA-degrading endonuclease RelE of RelBE toxin-antitoxin system
VSPLANQEVPAKTRSRHDRSAQSSGGGPVTKRANVAALKGERDTFRVRQSDWRAVYQVDRGAGQVRVITVAARREVYR